MSGTLGDNHRPDRQTAEQAAHWWVALHGDEVSAAEELAFGEWISRSPERVAAYLRLELLLRELSSKDVRWPAVSAEELAREASLAPSEPALLPTEASRAGPSRVRNARKRSFVQLGLAAAIILAVTAAWLFIAGPQRYETAIGEQRSVVLADGSLITLNTASRIEVDFGAGQRLIRLIRGEALFDVARDPTRPFDVDTGNATFRAVGTQFNVDRRSSGTTITVVEGKVAVIPKRVGAGTVRIVAAQRMTVTGARLGALQDVANIAAATVWTQRRLIFERRPLAEVAAEFNRYNRETIVIEDERLRDEEVTAVFQVNDTAAFVTFLAQIPGVTIHHESDGQRIVVAHEASAGVATR